MKKYGLHGKLIAAEGHGSELAAILLDAATLLGSVKGCRLYVISQDKEQKDVIWVTEIWDSQEDHANSLNTKGVKDLIAKAIPLLGDQPEKGQELEILGGMGI